MNDKHIALQKNGLYCIMDTTMRHILDYNLTKEDLVNMYAAKAIAKVRSVMREAPKFDQEYIDHMLKCADDDYKNDLKWIFDGMNPGANLRNTFTDFLIEIDFKNENVKRDFMYEIENVIKNKSVHVLFENEVSLHISFNDNLTPILVCKNDRMHNYVDTSQRDEYRFTIICPESSPVKNKSAVPINTYNMIESQFENIKDFESGNIVLHKFDRMIIVIFDIASTVKPILTLV